MYRATLRCLEGVVETSQRAGKEGGLGHRMDLKSCEERVEAKSLVKSLSSLVESRSLES